MSYNSKNYTEHGGERTVIGGELVIKNGGRLILEEGADNSGLPKAANQAESTATTVAGLKDDLNALIGKLVSAGLMESGE